MFDPPRVFISYARQDGEDFARALYRRLAREHPEITLWQDRARMEGGVGWWKQITDAIDAVQFLVLIATPTALRSPITRKEWRYARQQGVCVYPVKAAPDETIKFETLPRWMRKAHFFDLEREWNTFINYLTSPCQAVRVPFMAPDLLEGVVHRTALFDQLRDSLLSSTEHNNVASTTALYGAGGLGKTILAAAVCHDDEVITAFDDGILWVTLGTKPNVYEGLMKLYAALKGERPGFVDIEDAAFNLASILEGKNCLIVIDDVWESSHLHPFLRGGRESVRLITTRNFDIACDAEQINVDEMTTAESLQVLSSGMKPPIRDLESLTKLAERLDRWPLLLGLAGAALKHRIGRGDTPEGALQYLHRKLDKKGLLAFDNRNPTERRQALARTIEVSLELLSPEERQRFVELAIFPEDTAVPLGVVATLWDLDELDTEELIQRFDNLSLLRFDLRAGTVHLHDVIRGYLETHLPAPNELHARLISAWSDLHSLPEPYAWRWLTYHLRAAGKKQKLRGLLLDFHWLQAKLQATDVTALNSDFEWTADDEALRFVQEAIQLSAHVLANDKTQLAGQLLGRLEPGTSAEVRQLCQQAEQWRGAPWLRPLTVSLTTAGGALLLTLAGHAARVRSIALTPDGQRVVSSGDDQTVRVWNLDKGIEERCLVGHTDWVRAVAVVPDGSRVVSVSDDQTLRVWNIENGTEELIISTFLGWVGALVVTRDGKRVVAASDSGTLKLWSLESGEEAKALEGHTALVNGLATSADGRFLMSASDDRTIRVWGLENGEQKYVLEGHRGRVTAIAVAADNRVLSAASDETLRLWYLGPENAVSHRIISSRAFGIKTMAVTPDGRRAITGAEDHTLGVWDLEQDKLKGVLEGHTDCVTSVAVTPDGHRVVSGSDDHNLKIWNPDRATEERMTLAFSERIRAVQITPDGRYAIATADDLTLKVWDLSKRALSRTLPHDHGPFALLPDGQRVVSAGSDATLRIWDLDSGAQERVLIGHTDRVRAISVCPDGVHVVSGADDRTIRVWNCKSGSGEVTIPVRTHWIRDLVVTPDGKSVISASDGRALKLWSLESGTERLTLRGHHARVNAVAISPDGRFAVSTSDDHTVRVWDLSAGRAKRTLEGHGSSVNAVAVTSDGRYVISASGDCTVKIWYLESGKLVANFTGDSPMLACAVSPAEPLIVAGDQAGVVHFLQLEQRG